MSYQELASQLGTLGKKVADNHHRLEGIPLAKAAESLAKAASRFRIYH